MFLKQNPSCFFCFIQYGKQHKNHNGKFYKHTCFLRKTHYGFQILTVHGFYSKNINGKSSAFPLMVLIMGFSKIPFKKPVMFFCKIFLCMDPLIHDETVEDIPHVVTYQLVEAGTKHAKTELADSDGYTYNVQHRRANATYWQCTVRIMACVKDKSMNDQFKPASAIVDEVSLKKILFSCAIIFGIRSLGKN